MDRRELVRGIQAEIDRAALLTTTGWTTYAIRDPSKPDPSGHPSGQPVYVGQTNNFGRRVKQRMRSSGRQTGGKNNIDRILNGMMRRGVVPRFEPLEQSPTRLDSLVSETNWARCFINQGYRISNQWAEHKCGGATVDRSGVPHARLWEFMIGEAIESAIGVALRCKPCQIEIDLDLSTLAAMPEPPKRLRDVRDSGLSCPECGAKGGRYVKLNVAR